MLLNEAQFSNLHASFYLGLVRFQCANVRELGRVLVHLAIGCAYMVRNLTLAITLKITLSHVGRSP